MDYNTQTQLENSVVAVVEHEFVEDHTMRINSFQEYQHHIKLHQHYTRES